MPCGGSRQAHGGILASARKNRLGRTAVLPTKPSLP